MKTVNVIGSKIAVTNYTNVVTQVGQWAMANDRAYAVEAANTHTLSLARADQRFGKAFESFDLICPDGMPLVWAINSRVSREEKLTERVYGPTLMLKTMQGTAKDDRHQHFLLGGKQSTLDKLQSNLANKHGITNIAGVYSPPFGQWPADEFDRICKKISDSGANYVWVGLGCPKQELWIAENLQQLPNAVYFGVGAAFAFHAGEVSQAPSFIQNAGLEWLYRLCAEPRRLWKRYLVNNTRFLYYSLFDFRAN
ncbi:MAG: WecB/TagA/CpsF family glycosyltransferase [Rubripirellula sp.]